MGLGVEYDTLMLLLAPYVTPFENLADEGEVTHGALSW